MIKAVLFDIDGVLLDSFDANLHFFRMLLTAGGFPPPTREDYLPLFPRHMRDTIQILTKASDEKIDHMWEMARSGQIAYPNHLLKMPDGAKESIHVLSKRYKLGIVTSRIKESVFSSVDLSALRNFFPVTVSYQDTLLHKPHPEPVLLACEKLDVLPREAVFVGDAESDLRAGKAAGSKVIMYSPKPFNTADASFSVFTDLPRIIQTL